VSPKPPFYNRHPWNQRIGIAMGIGIAVAIAGATTPWVLVVPLLIWAYRSTRGGTDRITRLHDSDISRDRDTTSIGFTRSATDTGTSLSCCRWTIPNQAIGSFLSLKTIYGGKLFLVGPRIADWKLPPELLRRGKKVIFTSPPMPQMPNNRFERSRGATPVSQGEGR